MAWDVRNNIADIADIRIDDSATDSQFTTTTEFRLEVRTGSQEFDFDDIRVFAGFSRMTLELVCYGTEVAIGERHGDIIPTNDIVTQIARESTTTTLLGGKAGVSLDAATALTSIPFAASATAEGSRGTTEKRTTETSDTTKFVTAKPNDKWEISTLNRKFPLSAKYITTDDPLCVIHPKPKSNRTGIQAHLYAHKNDMVITSDEEVSRWSLVNPHKKNKERVFALLLGKSMIDPSGESTNKTLVKLSAISSFDPQDE